MRVVLLSHFQDLLCAMSTMAGITARIIALVFII